MTRIMTRNTSQKIVDNCISSTTSIGSTIGIGSGMCTTGSMSSTNNTSTHNCKTTFLTRYYNTIVNSMNGSGNGNNNNNNDNIIQFTVLVCGVFLFFGIHNYLQEAIMKVNGFHHYGVMLGYFEVFGVGVCSYIERSVNRMRSNNNHTSGSGNSNSNSNSNGSSNSNTKRNLTIPSGTTAPLSAYPLLVICLVSSSALSNISLNYINFPTKVVFRSCKLIPTMIIATFIHKQVYTSVEYTCAAAACIGLILYAAADWTTSPTFHPIGLLLVITSVIADAILPNGQERIFKTYNSSRLEVTLYTNIYVLIIMTVTTLMSGELIGCIRLIYSNTTLQVYFFIYTFIAHIAISFHMTIVKQYGGVVSVLVATGRKAMTLTISFILFPKTFSYYYPIGTILILGGLTISSLYKIYSKKSTSTGAIKNSADNTNFTGTSIIETTTVKPLLKCHDSNVEDCND